METEKPKKAQSERARLATTRNWTKLRLSGAHFDKSVMTEDELAIIATVESGIKLLLENWDSNSIKLGLTVGKQKTTKFNASKIG